MKKKNKAKKSFMVVGMSRFGQHLAMQLYHLDNAIMIVDISEVIVQSMLFSFENTMIGDCTNENVVAKLGVTNFDTCFVTIGSDFEVAMLVTALLKKYGAKRVVAKAGSDMQVELLKKIGADDVVYPEKQFAEKLAIRYSSNSFFDSIDLGDEYVLYEIVTPQDWIGQSIAQLNLRKKHNINILAIKHDLSLNIMPSVTYKLCANDIIVVVGKKEDMDTMVAN